MSLDPLTREIVSVYRGWEALERGITGEAGTILDFDLAPAQDIKHYTCREDVLRDVERLRDQVQPADDEGEFLRAKLHASAVYLRALLGETIPFDVYVEEILGTRPVLFTDAELDAARQKVAALLEADGVQYRAEDREKYEARCRLTDPAEVRARIEGSRDVLMQRLAALIPVPPLDDVTVEFANEDRYWAAWVSGSLKEGMKLRINLHPRTFYLKGSPGVLAAHEYCGHIVQAQVWRGRIAAGKMNQAVGLTTVHGREQFLMEGLAQIMERVLLDPANIEPEEALALEASTYSNMVYNNLHVLVNTGVAPDEVYAYARPRLPFASDLKLRSEIRDRGQSPLYRVYQYVYGISEHYFMQLLAFPLAKQQAILQSCYAHALTKAQLDRLFTA